MSERCKIITITRRQWI